MADNVVDMAERRRNDEIGKIIDTVVDATIEMCCATTERLVLAEVPLARIMQTLRALKRGKK